jgi:phosphopantetheinyl transferase (holo-ACP synthase)
LNGEARVAALKNGLKEILVSLTYCDDVVVAVAVGVAGEGDVSYWKSDDDAAHSY